MCGQRDAAWKYTPRGMIAASCSTNTSANSRLRETVPRIPSGSHSPVTRTPGALAGTAKYSVLRRDALPSGAISVASSP